METVQQIIPYEDERGTKWRQYSRSFPMRTREEPNGDSIVDHSL